MKRMWLSRQSTKYVVLVVALTGCFVGLAFARAIPGVTLSNREIDEVHGGTASAEWFYDCEYCCSCRCGGVPDGPSFACDDCTVNGGACQVCDNPNVPLRSCFFKYWLFTTCQYTIQDCGWLVTNGTCSILYYVDGTVSSVCYAPGGPPIYHPTQDCFFTSSCQP